MKRLTLIAAAAAFALALIGAAGASSGINRMVGGGWVNDPDLIGDPNIKVPEGMELWCAIDNPELRPSNLQITWGSGNYFHLTELNSVACEGNNPLLRDDGGMTSGSGEGRCNGRHAFISFVFLDNPDLRTGDSASIQIEGDDPDVCAVNVTGSLLGGNFTFIEDPNI
jgi:hypothetical protein